LKSCCGPKLDIALMHYPVVNKNGEVISSAVTNLDLHDIARAAKTYGVQSYYVVTPLADQKQLVERIVSHWTDGSGSKYNPKRREALELIRVLASFAEVLAHIRDKCDRWPKTVVTCAKRRDPSVTCDQLRRMLEKGDPYLLIFGTAWGLSEKFMAQADYVLEPISGDTAYNHLSVRSAAGIILDRILANNRR